MTAKLRAAAAISGDSIVVFSGEKSTVFVFGEWWPKYDYECIIIDLGLVNAV